MPPKGSGAAWDDAMEKKFLLTIIHLSAPKLPAWDKVAETMNEGFTGNALRQRWAKVKAAAKEQFGEVPGANAAAEDGETPKPKKGGKRKKKEIEEPEQDGEGEEESPAKKIKGEPKAEQDDMV